MHLKSLHIKNFRCFKDYTIEFAPGVTVLFGKNGSGKTTLIHAMHKALSFAFDKTIIKENKYNLAAGFKDLGVEAFAKTDQITDIKTGFYMPYISIEAVGNFCGSALEWRMYNTSGSSLRPLPKEYKSAYLSLMEKISETGQLPFFAYYSDGFPHTSSAKIPKEEEMSVRNVGYWDWNKETACSKIWITRLERTWKKWDREDRLVKDEQYALAVTATLLKTGDLSQEKYDEETKLHQDKLDAALSNRKKYEKEVAAIRDCLSTFFAADSNCEIKDVFISVDEIEELCLETSQGTNPAFRELPAGYQRLVYMVLDIAYRSYILNGTTDASGLVIIDEIDLHLHPELEQVVLQRFMRTFPRVQFVVSTHSPLVLTGIETTSGNNIVLQMAPNSNSADPLQDVHGIDYNLMLEENMGVTKRKPEIQMMFDEAWKKVSEKDILGAKRVIEHLESTTPSDQTELVRLRAIVNRLEVIGR